MNASFCFTTFIEPDEFALAGERDLEGSAITLRRVKMNGVLLTPQEYQRLDKSAVSFLETHLKKRFDLTKVSMSYDLNF